MNRTGIQLSFDTPFISVSLMVEFVFLSLKQKFASGDPLVAGFESRPCQHLVEKGVRISLAGGTAVPLKLPCQRCEGTTIFGFLHCLSGFLRLNRDTSQCTSCSICCWMVFFLRSRISFRGSFPRIVVARVPFDLSQCQSCRGGHYLR